MSTDYKWLSSTEKDKIDQFIKEKDIEKLIEYFIPYSDDDDDPQVVPDEETQEVSLYIYRELCKNPGIDMFNSWFMDDRIFLTFSRCLLNVDWLKLSIKAINSEELEQKLSIAITHLGTDSATIKKHIPSEIKEIFLKTNGNLHEAEKSYSITSQDIYYFIKKDYSLESFTRSKSYGEKVLKSINMCKEIMDGIMTEKHIVDIICKY